jgi:uncharacterized protein YdeI (YjbR/CyaY-like superfamily)
METKDGIKTFYAKSQKAWRDWLIKNHGKEKSIWLIIYKKESGIPSIYYPEAVDEALCFGWIDSKPNKRDNESYYQFFAQRNPKSNWSKVNKEKVERLIKNKQMTSAGMKMIDLAKKIGTWTALDNVENLVLPQELMHSFNKNKKALTNWEAFPKSAKRGILEWIYNAKKIETKLKRIEETVNLAAKNIKANFPKQ